MHRTIATLLLLCISASPIAAFAPARSNRNLHLSSAAKTTSPQALEINNSITRRKDVVLSASKKEVDESGEEKEDETKKGFAAIKSAGRAGAISLFLWEAAFWIIAGEKYTVATLHI